MSLNFYSPNLQSKSVCLFRFSPQKKLISIFKSENKPAYLQQFQQDHPTVTAVTAIAAGTGLVIAGTTVLAPSLLVATLNTVGFTASGIGGGTCILTRSECQEYAVF
jgi:hypothetical protein